ncbi:MAG: hypothetical protein M0R28_17855 [Pigmentiphaga sp.]|nr:hypothetical protein [Pigmentiphaga sp.]
MRSPQGSNIPANAFGRAPQSMGELTPPGLQSQPSTPGVIDQNTTVSRTGPNGLSSLKLGPLK